MTGRAGNAVVLCVDAATAGRIAYWLGAAGVDTAIARNGYEARSLLAGCASCLLVTDRLLPPWPGLATVNSLKQAMDGLSVAFVGDGVPDNDDLAMAAGADVVLPPPLRRGDVLDAFSATVPDAWRPACTP